MSKGTTARAIRIPDDTWLPASEAFPSDRGKTGGLSAEVQGFVAFLAEDPDRWHAVKRAAAERGVDPLEMLADSFRP